MPTVSRFDGQVTFDCGYHNLRVSINEDMLRHFVPEYIHFAIGHNAEAVFTHLPLLLAVTRGITFALNDPPSPVLAAFQAWWKTYGGQPISRETWEGFLEAVTAEILSEWITAYVDATASLLSPPDLQPDAVEDEALDPNAESLETA